MEDKAQITISEKLALELQGRKTSLGDTYDDVITRLITEAKKKK